MYRISIIKSSSIYTKGYFGPCSEEDVMSPEEIEKYRNPSNYFDISNFFSDESRLEKLKKLLKKLVQVVKKVGQLLETIRIMF